MNTKRAFKNELYEQFARIGRGLSSGRRLELLELLAQGERSVEELAAESDMPVASASQHLRALHKDRLVKTRREGTHIYYRLAGAAVLHLLHALRTVAEEQLAEVDRLVAEYGLDDTIAVTAPELIEKLRDGKVTLLDVRPSVEFEQGHIAGARSFPVEELARRLGELPPDLEIVAYCRGPYCAFADEAVRLLAANQLNARRLHEGFPEWKLAGYPIEMGATA